MLARCMYSSNLFSFEPLDVVFKRNSAIQFRMIQPRKISPITEYGRLLTGYFA